jgi:hypothetical protein
MERMILFMMDDSSRFSVNLGKYKESIYGKMKWISWKIGRAIPEDR